MRSLLSIIATVAVCACMVRIADGYPNDNGRSNGGSNGNTGGGNTGGGNTGSGRGNNGGGGGNNGRSSDSGGSIRSGASDGGHINTNTHDSGSHVRTDNGGGSSSGSSHSNTGKIMVNPNPAPKVVHSNHSDDAHKDKDHSKDVHTDSGKHTSTNHDHSNRTVNSQHYHSNSNYHYHHQPGKPWDKNEWQHCWNRWWYFHNNHVFYNGSWCWWDPDYSRWTVYTEGDTIPEDYYIKDETPPGGDAIRIVSPAELDATLSYAVNGFPFQIKPGDHQDLPTDRTWVIAFNRGGDFGNAEYTLEPGEYTFGSSDRGWELSRATASEEPTEPAPAESGLPKNPLPK
jgi:hypothetical protein